MSHISRKTGIHPKPSTLFTTKGKSDLHHKRAKGQETLP